MLLNPQDLRAAGSGPQGSTVCGHQTWVEEPCLQGGLQGHQQLLPLVGPLQAVLEVLDGRPGVREVCREKAVLTRRSRGVRGSPQRAAAIALTPFLPTCLTTAAPQGGQTAAPKGPIQSRDAKLRGQGRTPRGAVRHPPQLRGLRHWGGPALLGTARPGGQAAGSHLG